MKTLALSVMTAALLIWCGAAVAETMEFQQGVSPDASYEHDWADVVNVGISGSGWGAGALTRTNIGMRWNQSTDYEWVVTRYDLSDLAAMGAVTITGVTLEFSTMGADYMETASAEDAPDLWPATLTWNLYQIKEPNHIWIEGLGAAEGGNSVNELQWEVALEEVACWPFGGCTDAHLWPENHPLAPGRDAYNTYGTPIATVESTGDLGSYWGSPGKTIGLVFNAEGIAYIQSIVDGTIASGPDCGTFDDGCGDAGMLIEPPEELQGIGPTYYGNVRVATDDNETAAMRPKLIVEYTTGTVVPDVSGQSEGDAQQALEDAGYVVEVTYEASDSVPAGETIRTEPAAGSELDAGQTVTIIVSSGAAEVPVTGMVGLALLASACAVGAIRIVRRR